MQSLQKSSAVRRNSRIACILIAAAVILIDQFTKYLTRRFISPGDSISIIGDFLKLTLIYNDGAAFGILGGKSRLLLGLTFLLLFGLFLVILTSRSLTPFLRYVLSMIAAGGASNFIDRAVFGKVTDMISFSIFPPIFNAADIGVTVGVVLVILYLLITEFQEIRKSRAEEEAGAAACESRAVRGATARIPSRHGRMARVYARRLGAAGGARKGRTGRKWMRRMQRGRSCH